MKKALIVFMALLICLMTAIMASASTSDAVYTLSNVSGRSGDTVKLTLSFDSTKEANSLGIAGLTYDTNALTFEGFDDTADIAEKCILPPTFDKDLKAVVIPLEATTTSIDTVCSLVFKIKETAADGDYTVAVTTTVTKNGGTVITSSAESGSITVASNTNSVVIGDVNNDGKLTSLDIIILARHLANWKGYETLPYLK